MKLVISRDYFRVNNTQAIFIKKMNFSLFTLPRCLQKKKSLNLFSFLFFIFSELSRRDVFLSSENLQLPHSTPNLLNHILLRSSRPVETPRKCVWKYEKKEILLTTNEVSEQRTWKKIHWCLWRMLFFEKKIIFRNSYSLLLLRA